MRLFAHSRCGRVFLLIGLAYLFAFQGFAGALAGALHGTGATPAAHCAPPGVPANGDQEIPDQGLCCVLGHWPAAPALPPAGCDTAPVGQGSGIRVLPPRPGLPLVSITASFSARAPPLPG
jgi:hypothetical protein